MLLLTEDNEQNEGCVLGPGSTEFAFRWKKALPWLRFLV